MNANELADGIGNCTTDPLHKKAATMIRQQQAEIEALKDVIVTIEKNTDYWADKANWIKNNKPIAELVLEQMAVGDASSLRIKWLMDGYPPVGTKLYTQSNIQLHPLTDEEILELWIKKNNLNGAQDIVDFAKAILRKASEK